MIKYSIKFIFVFIVAFLFTFLLINISFSQADTTNNTNLVIQLYIDKNNNNQFDGYHEGLANRRFVMTSDHHGIFVVNTDTNGELVLINLEPDNYYIFACGKQLDVVISNTETDNMFVLIDCTQHNYLPIGIK